MEKNIISINKKITEKVKTIEISGDIIVPDIKPDIISIITTTGNTYIYKEEISKSRIRVDGNVDAYVIYLSENGETRSIQTTLNFIENLDDDNISEDMHVKESVVLRNIETRILNERKITVKANVEIKCEFFENSNIEMFNRFEELQDVEKLEESLKVRSIRGLNRVKSSIKENINVDNNCDVAEILKTDISLSNYENKISYNKVLAKADVNIKIMFLTEDGLIKTVQETYPLMSFIDIENILEENICNIDYMVRNMLFKANSKEMHSISCQVDFEVNCEVFENKEINTIQDMYGTKKDINFSKKEVEVQTDTEPVVLNIRIDEKILIEDITNIHNIDANALIVNKTMVGGFANYEGEIELTLFYETDNRNGLNIKKAKIPFFAKGDIDCNDAEARIENKQFDLNNEYINCGIDAQIVQRNMSLRKINLIENLEYKEIEDSGDYNIIIYFIKHGDTIWNIAKKFRVSMDSIIKTNMIENPNMINSGDKLYIVR